MKKMKSGDFVTVYEDPLTEKKLEGKAELVTLLKDEEDKQFWLVEFHGEAGLFGRWIKKA